MNELDSRVRDFFKAYEKRSNDALKDPPHDDVDGMVAAFAPYFVGSSPKGVLGGANDEAFRQMLPKGFAHYRKVGGTAMTITDLSITRLDDLHAVAHVEWAFAYRAGSGALGEIKFRNHYFVTIADGTPKIFGYVTPDEEAAMKEHGLM